MVKKTRFEGLYLNTIKNELMEELKFSSPMQVPRLVKIVINVGLKEAVSDGKIVQYAQDVITAIAGQKAVRCNARKSIASFKLREGMPIGVMVTLRRKNMYEFLDKLITLALPRIRDFQGVSKKMDGRGNYNLGLKEWTIFPEIDFAVGQKIAGLNVTINTSAKSDEEAVRLLQKFGMPFKKQIGSVLWHEKH
jgi:large subunit ribosomal protein L5